MEDLDYSLLVVLCVNVMLFLGQFAVLEINPEGSQFFNCKGSLLGSFEETGCNTAGSYVLNSSNPVTNLPSGASSVSASTGNIFTDTFTGIKTWLLDVTGLGYLIQILAAPYNFLTAIGLPVAFVFAVGSLWYGITLFLIIAWLFGR